jgi:hypothetical protein
MSSQNLKPGDKVTFTGLPSGFLDDLPEEDQLAIAAAVGKPVQLNEFDENGRTELEFTDNEGISHTIWINPALIRSAD